MSVRQWCQEQKVHPTTYYKWEREVLRPDEQSKPNKAFVELPAPKMKGNVYERIATIRYGDFSVDVCAGTSKQELYSGQLHRNCTQLSFLFHSQNAEANFSANDKKIAISRHLW